MPRYSAAELRRRGKMLQELRTLAVTDSKITNRIAWTRPLTREEKEIVPQLNAAPSMPLRKASGGVPRQCFHNCFQMAKTDSSFRVVLGWIRYYEGSAVVRFYISHAVLERDGELFDPTPRPGNLEDDPFIPDAELTAAWIAQPNGDLRINLVRRGANINEAGLRTPNGILSLEWVWSYSFHPKTTNPTPQYVIDQ